jgi:hypothetical protein
MTIEFKKQIQREEKKEIRIREKIQRVEKERKKGYFDNLVKTVLFSYTKGKPFVLNPPSTKFYYSFFFIKGKEW